MLRPSNLSRCHLLFSNPVAGPFVLAFRSARTPAGVLADDGRFAFASLPPTLSPLRGGLWEYIHVAGDDEVQSGTRGSTRDFSCCGDKGTSNKLQGRSITV